MEASKPTSKPLVLEVWKNYTNLIAQAPLYLNITSVEAMFRHKSLISETFPSTNGPGDWPDRLADTDVPNEPDTNGKNFVFLHGYNVNPDEARGAFAETFKRLYWSGSHAKFYGVTWRGAESRGSLGFPLASITPNYHTNAAIALTTAPHLAEFLATLTNGPTTVAAHSLGNMVVLSAMSDWGARPAQYFMVDAAVAVEAIDGLGSAPSTNMIYPSWQNYSNVRRIFASDWFRLFVTNDARSSLFWSNRLANLSATNIYNFYSSGEEVLREYLDGAPPSGILAAIPDQLAAWWTGDVGVYAWAWQEKAKGRALSDHILGSTHGGWALSLSTNYYTYYYYQDGYVTNYMSPFDAANVPADQLKTNAFFQMTSPTFAGDAALYGANASTYAVTNRNRILADAIPALTLPVGANPVPMLSPAGQSSRNLNMQTLYENGWPASRSSGSEARKWHHSDFRGVAYVFTHPLFDEFVNKGQLQ